MIGVPFGLWSIYVISNLCDTCGTLVSFLIVMPGVILGLPWSIAWLFFIDYFDQSVLTLNILTAGFVLCVMVNGAIVGAVFARASKKS